VVILAAGNFLDGARIQSVDSHKAGRHPDASRENSFPNWEIDIQIISIEIAGDLFDNRTDWFDPSQRRLLAKFRTRGGSKLVQWGPYEKEDFSGKTGFGV
jgi:hypothetical protein